MKIVAPFSCLRILLPTLFPTLGAKIAVRPDPWAMLIQRLGGRFLDGTECRRALRLGASGDSPPGSMWGIRWGISNTGRPGAGRAGGQQGLQRSTPMEQKIFKAEFFSFVIVIVCQ
jgi:hypothetical protein